MNLNGVALSVGARLSLLARLFKYYRVYNLVLSYHLRHPWWRHLNVILWTWKYSILWAIYGGVL